MGVGIWTQQTLFNAFHANIFTLTLKHRTSLDQTTLNQSVSVNGVHSDNDTSQVRHVFHMQFKCFSVSALSYNTFIASPAPFLFFIRTLKCGTGNI